MLLIRIIGAVLLIGLVAVVAMNHGKSAVGLNGILWSAGVIARTAGTFGLDLVSLRAIAEAQEKKRSPEAIAARYQRILFKVWGVALGILAAGCVGTAFWSVELAVVLLNCFVVGAAAGMQRLWYVQMIATGRTHLAQALESVCLPLLAIFGAVLTSGAGTGMLLASQAGAYVIVGLAFWRLSPGWRVKPDTEHVVVWRAASTNFFATAFTAVAVRAPIFFVGFVSAGAAGSYEVAQRVQSAGSLGVTAVATSALPILARSAKSARRRAMGMQLLAMGAMASLMPLLLLAGLLALGKEGTRRILGGEYGDVWLPASVLMVGSLVNASTSCISNLLAVASLERLFLTTSVLQFCTLFGVLVLLPDFSPLNASIAVLCSETTRSIALIIIFLTKYRPVVE